MRERSPRTLLGETRYRFAAGFCEEGDVVVDAACGTGFAEDIFPYGVIYRGVDYWEGAPIVADLHTWGPDFDFDVWVGLETIEHLHDLDVYIASAKRARKFIVISTPIVPTTHYNEWHVRDHDADDVKKMFVDTDWELLGELRQFDTAGFEYGLFAFRRRPWPLS